MSERLFEVDLYDEIVGMAQWDTEDLLNHGDTHWQTLMGLVGPGFDPNERRPVVYANGATGPNLPVLAAFAMNLRSQKWEQIEEAHPFFERVAQWLLDHGADPALSSEDGLTADNLAPVYLKRFLMEARGEPFEWHEQRGLLEATAKRLNTGNLTIPLLKELDKHQQPLGLPMGFGCILVDFPQAFMAATRALTSPAEKNHALNALRARVGWWKKAIERAVFQAPEHALELRAVAGFMALALVTTEPQPEGKVVWQSLIKSLEEKAPQNTSPKLAMAQAMERAMDGRLGPLTPLVCQVMASPFPPAHTPAPSTFLAAVLRLALTRQDWAQWSDQADLPAVSSHTERLVKKVATLSDVPSADSDQAQQWMAQLPVERGSVLLLQLAVFREEDPRYSDNPWLPWIEAWMAMHPNTRRGMDGLFSRLQPQPLGEEWKQTVGKIQATVRSMAMDSLLEAEVNTGRPAHRPRL